MQVTMTRKLSYRTPGNHATLERQKANKNTTETQTKAECQY